MFTFINRFTVDGDTAEFEKRLADITAHMTRQPGFHSHRLYRSGKDPKVYVELAEWEDAAAHQRAARTEEFLAAVRHVQQLATADPAPYTLLTVH
ncbi:antibiotic biosynthesis monooxygenase [Streptomyces lydicamycinicus]|uniref:Acyl-CoA synthetase n=1 Tax=Streptomyces lydicamycinicus TaxID=1546107 RepID=A0A0P4RA28_9ACTN|nr:antibiotic biosynthesis monooxygenase family protein [Streptomyces lydicamycinicus]USA00146.1 antibiotic biosynthesis monooxygenase [Streptomyces lydicamycinicus]GAO10341.1 acyl-CoA synthetase [Streptomyces lydicamycinicus]